ncbi:MlaA family lipoprotein [Microbulbifer marinus]|uniref:ABC-type transporter Mla maintaining outer membrane lipid asymmetry, lipoprotein component MlaA n=1 Tax=Microbulbifer marinus TaxID=658218 RepID=A0A1H4AG24_9GAMM|nr:VacJ family lipoprotein [Microbulbifer marinus]SEA34484.1 ABC-type transporter Mla maintaining outer membrane lipid asymmetry, lipoprotein component MlaA [Microbulbifer marinus]
MLGRIVISLWLIAATMAAAPALSFAAQDPFAEGGQEVAAPQEPAGNSVTTDSDSADTADSDAAQADGEDPSAESGDTTAESGSLADEYGFDPADEFASDEEPATRDPWEGYNRAMFRFNDTADRWVLKPVATSYRQITPIFLQYGISNFFDNMREVTNSLNSVLQGKWGQAGNDAGRFLVNTTVGVAGFFDVAQHIGLEEGDGEDFGQTLAVWGVPSGPYLVLPFLGPSTARDAPGRVVDIYTNPLTYVDHDPTLYALKLTDIIQTRASLLKVESLLQGDRYVLLRDAYMQRREFLINDGAEQDDFGDDLEEGEEGDQEGGQQGAREQDPFAF